MAKIGYSFTALADIVDAMVKREEARYPLGHNIITMNAANPSTYGYPGTWVLQAGDASLYITSTPAEVNKVVGENNPIVPIPRHTHTGVFSGKELARHSHTSGVAIREQPIGSFQYGGLPGNYRDEGTSGPIRVSNHPLTSPESAGVPSGTVSIADTGLANAKLDVRGRRLPVYMFTRTA